MAPEREIPEPLTPPASDPPELAQQKERAWTLIDGGQPQQAQALLQEALKTYPDDEQLQALVKLSQPHKMGVDGSALLRKVQALGSSSDPGALPPGEAKPILASAIGMPAITPLQAPPALRSTLPRATFLKMKLRDYGGAENDLTATIQADPNNWLAYRLRAFTRRFMKKIPEAESDATQALRLNPKDGASHNIKALLRMDAGDPKSALVEATAAVALNPKDSDSLATRAFALQALGRNDEALADLKAAAELDPQFVDMYRHALYEHGATPKLSQARGLYLGAAGLALMFLGLSLVVRRAQKTTMRRPAMRAADQTSDGVPGFRIVRRIGQGGMGVVYEAYDETLQRKVALKRMRDEISADPRARRHFLKEARTVAALRHQSIVEIFSVVEQDAALYLVFEFLPGQTLDVLLDQKGGRFSPTETLPLARQIAEALDYAHSQGVVHQDLKPSNIAVAGGLAKVMDFGIARRVQDTLSTVTRGEAVGTPAYMAPEQEQGLVTPKADLYSFGVCLYQLLSGRAPFGRGDNMLSKAEKRFPPLSGQAGLPEAVDSVIDSALDPDPAKRPLSARAIVASLEKALAHPTA